MCRGTVPAPSTRSLSALARHLLPRRSIARLAVPERLEVLGGVAVFGHVFLGSENTHGGAGLWGELERRPELGNSVFASWHVGLPPDFGRTLAPMHLTPQGPSAKNSGES